MVLGWKNENPDALENDEGSFRAIDSELVVDRRENEPSQNSDSNKVVANMNVYAIMQVCKYESMQVCTYMKV